VLVQPREAIVARYCRNPTKTPLFRNVNPPNPNESILTDPLMVGFEGTFDRFTRSNNVYLQRWSLFAPKNLSIIASILIELGRGSHVAEPVSCEDFGVAGTE
jgi:hypothetical protein